jgi:hypothetical protein
MNDALTVSELAKAVCPFGAAPAQVDFLSRRIRHWTLSGLLPTLGEKHVGAGRNRHYPADAMYLVALLNSLADFGLSVWALRSVAFITGAADRVAGMSNQTGPIEQAKRGEAEVYLIAHGNLTTDDVPPMSICAPEHLVEKIRRMEGGRGVVLNLTALFATLRR